MPRWQREFRRWRTTRDDQTVEQVVALLRRVFGDRLVYVSGTSHQFFVEAHEISDQPYAPFGHLSFAVKHGQRVKPIYLRNAYKAAVALGLYPPMPEEGDEDEDTE